MVTKSSLDGLKVLVTRPHHQAGELCRLVEDAGGEVIAFPTINIVPLAINSSEKHALDKYDIIIFVSRNAVAYFDAQLQASLAQNILAVAIGASTAQHMHKKGFKAVIKPDSPAGSERVLALPELHNVEGKQVLIVRGQDGRELLADRLTERGATVSYLEVYRRALPSPMQQQLDQAKQAECIIISSVNSLENLCQLVGEENFKNKRLIVVSNRIKQYAIGQGFKQIDVAVDASDTALMEQLIKVDK
jgi:uroporphyrinogen-III synthase